MKAIRVSKFGGPEVLSFGEVPLPEPGQGEVLVRVAACGVNNLDLQVRSGRFSQTLPLPHIPGSEIAGEIAGVGPGVRAWRIGDRVAICPWVNCGECEPCASGQETTCLRMAVVGLASPGGYAEYVVVPTRTLVAVPNGLDLELAAGLTLAAATAWHMLVNRARVGAGERVLVLSAGSGVGSAAVQIAKLFGAWVAGTVGTDEKLAHARKGGADAALNHTVQDLPAEIMRLTNGRGVDVIVDPIGEATWSRALSCLARNGRIVNCGMTSGKRGELNLQELYAKQLTVLGSRGGTRRELAQILDLAARGHLRPVIDRIYSLEQAGQAHYRLQAREQFGKILLRPSATNGSPNAND